LQETLPGASKIALLVNPNNPGLMQDNIELSKVAMQRLGLAMIVVKAGNENEIEGAVLDAVQQQANALSVGNDAYLSSRSRQVALLALRYALPTMSESRNGVADGLLMSYGPNQGETFRQAGHQIGRILKGERPADLPVIQPTNIELFLNLTTAKALGLTVPPAVLARADEIIE
jgi:putative ABC transport system substrate-binding protein